MGFSGSWPHHWAAAVVGAHMRLRLDPANHLLDAPSELDRLVVAVAAGSLLG